MSSVINRLKLLIFSSKSYFVLITIIVLLMVWFLGPKLALDGQPILHSLTSRFIVTAVIVGVWFNYGLVHFILARRLFHARAVGNPVSREKQELVLEQTILNDLKQDCAKVLQMSKKGCPWVLLIGPPGCGKTSFLSQLPFQLTSPTEVTLTHAKTTQWIDWWVGEQAVFIDPAGKFAVAQTDEPSEQIVWRSLIKLLKKNRKRAPIHHILLMVDISTLSHTNNPTFNDLIEHLIYQLQLLKSLQNYINVLFIITQSDRIVGFNEFFDDLSDQERKQAFGFKMVGQKDLAQAVDSKFDEFVRGLSARSLWRMHHEHSLHKRGLIQEFPLQMEKLGQRLKTITSQLPWNNQLQLSGIYFISSLQHQHAIDFLQHLPVSQTFGLQKHQQSHVYHEQHKYFIDQLMLQMITETQGQHAINPRKIRIQLAGVLASIVIIGGLTLFWHQSYQRNVSTLNKLLITLNSPQKMTPETVILPWLHQLNTLQSAINSIIAKQTAVAQVTGLDQSQHVLNLLQNRYTARLQTAFLPYLAQSLTTLIEQSKGQNETALYNALKVYLALLKNHDDVGEQTLIKSWFNQYWQQTFVGNKKLQVKLNQHLAALLKLKTLSWPANEVLIDQAQNELRQLPPVDRAFLKLQVLYPLAPVSILPGVTTIDHVDLSQATVCSFCTTDQFQQVYSKQIPKIAKTFEDADAVFGTTVKAKLSQLAEEKLTEELQNTYLNYYRQQWAAVLPNIRIIPAKTVTEAQHTIAVMRNPSSQFWKILHLVYDNMTLDQFKSETDENKDPTLQTLRILFNQQSDLYQETKYALDQLSDYLFQLNEMTEIDKASYTAAVNRFENKGEKDAISLALQQAAQSPILLRPWLQAIAQGAWQAILTNARQYLNTIWTTTVTPEYHEFIAQRYPLFRNAADDVSVRNFNHFFGPGGTLEEFFNLYLKPFINLDQTYWTFKSLDNESIGISQNTLDMLIRASMIQQMFYTDNHQQIAINFSLIPMKLGESVNGLTLNLGSQIVQFNHESHSDEELTWPPQDAFVTLLFNGIDGNTPSTTLSGPWALFRLLDQSDITATQNAKEYKVKFKIKQYSADYLLVANHLINPFIPGILNKFRCPSKL